MKYRLFQVDAFTNQLFSGNPAAVVPVTSPLSNETMQAIAAENNLSETAFIEKKEKGYDIRWLTPTTEVNLCGHATLAAAHVIFYHLDHPDDSITFSSRSGPLHVRKESDHLTLDFPTDTLDPIEAPQYLTEGLGATPKEIYKGQEYLLAIFEKQKTITDITPNLDKLKMVPAKAVIISAPGEDADFVSRFFAPQLGVPEDPVTGSAHTILTPYWSKKLGKETLTAKQLSTRGGALTCRHRGERIDIGGQTVTYLIGEIDI